MKQEMDESNGDARPSKSNHRRIFAVTNSLQCKLLALFFIYGFIIVSFFVIAVIGPDIMEMRNDNLSLEFRGHAAHRVLSKSAWIWPVALGIIALLALHSFFELQKVFGPLYRFRWAVEQLAKGHLISAVTTRENDYLEGERESLNKMLGSLAEIIRLVRQETEASLTSVDELENTINAGGEMSTTQLERLQAHREQIDRLAAAVRFFRLQDEQQQTAVLKENAAERHNGLFKEEKHEPPSIAGG